MPHITIEYSANVDEHHDIGALIEVVHETAMAHGLPPRGGLRTRAVARQHYRVANGDPLYAFIAINARMGPGRDADTKTSFLTQVLDAAEQCIAGQGGPLVISWSMEITEIDAEFRINRNYVRTQMQETG